MPPTKKRESTEKLPIPTSLHRQIVKIQAADELSWYDACEKAAILLDPNSNTYKDAVVAEADKLYKSKFMTQLNKTRKKTEMAGYLEGFADAVKECEIGYYCSVCGEKLKVNPDSDEHKEIIDYLHKQGWRHSTCQQG